MSLMMSVHTILTVISRISGLRNIQKSLGASVMVSGFVDEVAEFLHDDKEEE